MIINLIAKKNKSEKEKYATFFYFDNLRKTMDLDQIWSEIQQKFLLLKDWFKNHTLYHKIGYLIYTGYSLQEIFNLSEDKTKTEFVLALDKEIKNVVKLPANKDNYGELSYENSSDYNKISNLLLLFNVESTMLNGEQSQWFAFDKFKDNQWSLEHIHAQHSEGLKTQEQFKEWIKLHRESVEMVGKIQVENKRLTQQNLDLLLKEMEDFKDQKINLQEKFEKIQGQVAKILSEDLSVEYEHSIANLALLNTQDNAALNNSTFDVKRNKIIEMDKEGKFIPYCTKMVFLKYYTKSQGNQLHFWGQIDRESYIEEINKVLRDFIDEIKIEKEND